MIGVLIVLSIVIVAMIVALLLRFFDAFNRETKVICIKMEKAANDDEYIFWRKELRRHYLCLVPFVNRKNVSRVYDFFFYKARHEKKVERKDGFWYVVSPSFIGLVICAVCLCGATWAWYSANTSETVKIQSASFFADINVTRSDDGSQTNVLSDGTAHLEGNETYSVKLTAVGTATTGFCRISFENNVYYTDQLAPGETVEFTLKTAESGSVKIEPQWGIRPPDGSKISNGDVIGNGTDTHEKAASVAENTVESRIEVSTESKTGSEHAESTPESTPESEPDTEPEADSSDISE